MGINQQVWSTLGGFDEAFGRGYGEENDWCMRAIQAGYKNIVASNLFIYHKHGGSFTSEEKEELCRSRSSPTWKHPSSFWIMPWAAARMPIPTGSLLKRISLSS
jgi:GT2 family glycosyltransferase